MEPAPLCSIGVSSWSARGAEAGFDVIASGTPAVTTVVALYPGGCGWRPPTHQPEEAKPEPITLATGHARAESS